MRHHLPKVLIVLVLAFILGVPFALEPRQSEIADNSPAGDKLIIFTPNNEQIRYEFARGFNIWRKKRNLPPVRFDWRASGGTSDLMKLVFSELRAKAEVGEENQGVGADLFFGGGAFNHDILARGITIKRHGKMVRISASVPAKLPPGLLQAAFPKPAIAGQPLYDPKLYWVGTALSSFGIVYNRDLLNMLHLPQPRTWTDLAAPGYLHWVALADPAHSGSIAFTYDVILRHEGWNRGWNILRRVFANASSFSAGASDVPLDVSAGEAAAGMCIDFYGRFQAGAVGGHRVGYVDPAGMTAITADPISLLRGAPHKKIAEQFIVWILSKPAQRLWQRKVGVPGGPQKYELRRQPIRRDLYTRQERTTWTDPEIDPFNEARALPAGMPDFYTMVSPLSHAIGIDVHDQLTAAWSAIIHTPKDDPARAKMLAVFDAMPDMLTIHWPGDLAGHWQAALANNQSPDHARVVKILHDFAHRLSTRYRGQVGKDQLLRDQGHWTNFFRSHYERVAAMAP